MCCLFRFVQLALVCLWSVSSVRLLLDTSSAVRTSYFFFFFCNCMNGEWNIVFLRSCLFAMVFDVGVFLYA